MGKHLARPANNLAGWLLPGAVASGALAAAALSTGGTANATSTSTSFAIGIGNDAKASAQGLFNGAIAITASPSPLGENADKNARDRGTTKSSEEAHWPNACRSALICPAPTLELHCARRSVSGRAMFCRAKNSSEWPRK